MSDLSENDEGLCYLAGRLRQPRHLLPYRNMAR